MRKRVSVTFVKDDDVVQHIIPADDKKGERRRTDSRSLSYSAGVDSSGKKRPLYAEVVSVSESSDDGEGVTHLSALSLTAHQQYENISGQEVFSFRTPKKGGQMVLKASESVSQASAPSQTGKSQSRKHHSADTPVAMTLPGRKSKASQIQKHRAPQTTTPYRLRKRNDPESENSSDDDSVGEESDEDDESEEEKETQEKLSLKRPSKPSILGDLSTNAEQYFDIHAAEVVTSDRTLARLDLPQMDVEVLRETLSKVGTTHTDFQKRLWSSHQLLFKQWMFSMCNGFNILLYGLGSKRDFLEEFRKKYLLSFSHLVVNGYFPSLTIKQILNSITEDILGHEGSFHSPLDQVDFIKNHFEKPGNREDFYLLLHNIDGAMLRGEKTQNILSLLAHTPGIHVVASLDHINAPLIWDQAKCSRFRWLWQDVTTFVQYIAETSYENSLLVQQSGGLALRSLAHVMRSLTPNARKIFELLAKYQLDHNSTSYIGMSFQDLYQRCRESFLVNSDQTLRAQLVEFRDHKLIRAKKNFDGVETMVIPIESAALKEFLEQGEKF